MLRLIDEFQMNSAGNAKAKLLIGKAQLAKGTVARNVAFHITAPIKNSTNAAAALTGEEAFNVMSCICATLLSQFGQRADPEIIDGNLPFEHMRMLLSEMTGSDFKVKNQVTGRIMDLAAIPPKTAITPAIAAGASGQFEFEFVRSFELPDAAEHRLDFCPGATQMAKLYCEFTRGGDAGSGMYSPSNIWQQPTGVQFRAYADIADGKGDVYAPVVRLLRSSDAGLSLPGPQGALLTLLETSQPMAQSPFGNISLLRAGDSPVYSGVTYDDLSIAIARAQQVEVPPVFRVDSVATYLFRSNRPLNIQDFTTGQFTFEQPDNDLARPDLAWIVIPDMSAKARSYAKKATSVNSPSVSLQPVYPTFYPPHIRGISPVVIRRPEDGPSYRALPGLTYTHNDPAGPQPFVPAGMAAQIQAADPSSPETHLAVQNVSSLIPGNMGTRRSNPHVGAPALVHRLIRPAVSGA